LLGAGGWSLRAKLAAVIAGGALVAGAALLTAGLVATRGVIRDRVQSTFVLSANSKARAASGHLSESLILLRGIAVDRAVVAACERANAEHPAAVATYTAGLNPRWLRAGDESQLVRSVVAAGLNPVSAQMRRHVAGLPQVVQVLVTDDLGVVIAATDRPDAHFNGDLPWWQALGDDERGRQYVGVYRPFGSPDAYQYVELAVPVYRDPGARSELVGAVFARVEIAGLVAALRASSPSDGAESLVLDEVGSVVVATDPGQLGSVADTSWWQSRLDLRRDERFHEARMVDGTPVLLGHVSFADLDLGGAATPGSARDAVTLGALPWTLYVYEARESAYAGELRGGQLPWAVGVGGILALSLVGLILAGVLVRPIQRLTIFAEDLAEADETERAGIHPHREAGALARALNALLDERETLRRELSANEAQAEADRARRRRDADVATSIGALSAESTDVASLAQQSVELVREHYSLYYVGLYLVDDTSRYAVLRAGTGETGRALLAQTHRVAAGHGLVGQCAVTGRVQIDRDLNAAQADEEGILPYARAEIAVPLRSRGSVIGVLVADSYQAEAFDDETVVAMRVIADQVAVAVDSLRLYAESQAATDRLRRAYGELTRQAWRDALGGQVGRGYEALASGVEALPPQPPADWPVYQRDAWVEQRTVVAQTLDRAGVATHRCVIPIRVRDEIVGVMDVSKPATQGEWTAVELDELAGLSEQLAQALENARLFEAAQQNAMQEQMVGGVTRRMRETLSVDTVLQTAVAELRTLLDLEGVEIRVGPADVRVG